MTSTVLNVAQLISYPSICNLVNQLIRLTLEPYIDQLRDSICFTTEGILFQFIPNFFGTFVNIFGLATGQIIRTKMYFIGSVVSDSPNKVLKIPIQNPFNGPFDRRKRHHKPNAQPHVTEHQFQFIRSGNVSLVLLTQDGSLLSIRLQ